MGLRRTVRWSGLVVGLSLLVSPAWGLIQRLTPLEEVLKEGQFIFTAKVDKIDPDKPSLLLTVDQHLKGKAPFERLPINLNGDAEAKKLNHTPQLLDRLAVKLPLVVFVLKQEKQFIAFGYSNGTWFQMTALEAGAESPVWSFAHCEPYLRRTFKGTTEELTAVVKEGLAGKKKPPAPNAKEIPGLGPPVSREGKKQGALPQTRGPLLAVIPSVALGGILSLLAMLFPALFGGLTGQLRRWLAVISVASLNSTLLFLHDLFASSLQGSWWGTALALWVTMTTVTVLGAIWAWRRHRFARAQFSAYGANLFAPPSQPGRAEHILLWTLSLVGVALVSICLLLDFPLRALPWSFVLALWVGIWAGTLYVLVTRVRSRGPETGSALSAEGVILGTMAPACLVLGLTGATSAAPVVETGTQARGARYLGEAWAFQPEGKGFIVSSPLVVDDRVYTAVAFESAFRPFGKLYCLDASNGKVVWEFNDEGALKQVFSSPCLAKGRLYIGEGFHQDFDCKLYCLDAATGQKLWAHATRSHTESSPVVVHDRVYFGAGDDGIYCLDALTGKEVWHFDEGLHVDAPPLIVGDRLYVGSGVGDIHKTRALVCLDIASGKRLWTVPTELPAWNTPAFADGHLYVGLGNGTFLSSDERPAGAVLCVRIADRQRVWYEEFADGILCRPVTDEGGVYVTSRDGYCYNLDRMTGRMRWKRDLGSPAAASPALAPAADGRGACLYAVGSTGRLCCLDPNNGEIFWTFNMTRHQATMLASPAVGLGPEAKDRRRIYLGAGLNGRTNPVLYCLEDHWSPSFADSP